MHMQWDLNKRQLSYPNRIPVLPSHGRVTLRFQLKTAMLMVVERALAVNAIPPNGQMVAVIGIPVNTVISGIEQSGSDCQLGTTNRAPAYAPLRCPESLTLAANILTHFLVIACVLGWQAR